VFDSVSYLPTLGRCFRQRRAVVFVRLEKSCSVRRWSGLSGLSSGLERWDVSMSLVMEVEGGDIPPTLNSPPYTNEGVASLISPARVLDHVIVSPRRF
jgi:hypothetical protein